MKLDKCFKYNGCYCFFSRTIFGSRVPSYLTDRDLSCPGAQFPPALERFNAMPSFFHFQWLRDTVVPGTLDASDIVLYPWPDLHLDTLPQFNHAEPQTLPWTREPRNWLSIFEKLSVFTLSLWVSECRLMGQEAGQIHLRIKNPQCKVCKKSSGLRILCKCLFLKIQNRQL